MKKNCLIKQLIKNLKKFEKVSPHIILIPENDFHSSEKVEGGEYMCISNASIMTGMELKKCGNKDVLYITTKKVLEEILDQVKSGDMPNDLIFSTDELLIKKDDEGTIEELLKNKADSAS